MSRKVNLLIAPPSDIQMFVYVDGIETKKENRDKNTKGFQHLALLQTTTALKDVKQTVK